VAFDDSAFAITSAIPRAAAIPMYNGERGADAKNTFKTNFGGRSRLSFQQSIFFGVPAKNIKNESGRDFFSAVGRRVGGPGSPGRIYDPYFYILQVPA
jgi:hypothetical protein